jgi:hypothetical protein
LEVKIAISSVSLEGAKLNYNKEIANKSFDQVYKDADESWKKNLSKIKVTGGTKKQKEMFYSCLYRQFWYPSLTSDADGKIALNGAPKSHRYQKIRSPDLTPTPAPGSGMFSVHNLLFSICFGQMSVTILSNP